MKSIICSQQTVRVLNITIATLEVLLGKVELIDFTIQNFTLFGNIKAYFPAETGGVVSEAIEVHLKIPTINGEFPKKGTTFTCGLSTFRKGKEVNHFTWINEDTGLVSVRKAAQGMVAVWIKGTSANDRSSVAYVNNSDVAEQSTFDI